MVSLGKISVSLKECNELVIIQGLVVPAGSIVHQGLAHFQKWPSNEVSVPLFKQLFALKKKRIIEEDEDVIVKPVELVQDEEDDDDDFDDEDSTTEEEESD